MPKTQTLMLYFDVTKSSGKDKGEFAADAPAHRSKVWLDQAGNPHPDNQPLSVAFADNVDLSVQMSTNVPVGSTVSNLRITVVLWRTHDASNKAKYDSPFVDTKGKEQTVFDQNFAAAAGAASVDLGVPVLNSGTPGNHDRYMFLIAAMLDVNDGTGTITTFTAAHDPQMDIGV